MITVDPQRNTQSLLLWFLDEIIDGNIVYIASDKNKMSGVITLSLSNYGLFTSLHNKMIWSREYGIKVATSLIELSCQNKLSYLGEEKPEFGQLAQTFKFYEHGEINDYS